MLKSYCVSTVACDDRQMAQWGAMLSTLGPCTQLETEEALLTMLGQTKQLKERTDQDATAQDRQLSEALMRGCMREFPGALNAFVARHIICLRGRSSATPPHVELSVCEGG